MISKETAMNTNPAHQTREILASLDLIRELTTLLRHRQMERE